MGVLVIVVERDSIVKAWMDMRVGNGLEEGA